MHKKHDGIFYSALSSKSYHNGKYKSTIFHQILYTDYAGNETMKGINMNPKQSDWYKQIWSLDIKNHSWVEDTEKQVNFIIETLSLKGNERILDLACGYGRHSLSFARKGFEVVGVDITKEYIEDAIKTAKQSSLSATFLLTDIRDVTFTQEFDVVLNLADGAIGYLENDMENLKIFDIISNALKPGGKHFMDICRAEHAELYFPKYSWEAGSSALSLSQFEWNPEKRIMLYGGYTLPYGESTVKPEIINGDPIRLYSLKEIKSIFKTRNMMIQDTYSDYLGASDTEKSLQLMVYSKKQA
jgi:2-polyprenyl-3-methyl-5-hydroxy-6-metoxy-1,4-benzoquinol methylase